MSEPHLWILSEVKPAERRTPATPSICAKLIDEGFKITIEKCPNRIVKIEDYEKVGCTVVERGTWKDAPVDATIFHLKELPEEDEPLNHSHIFFAHCFKYQTGWKELLERFRKGKGTILDLEFLTDDRGVRVAAFGYMAGYTGMALGIDVWCHKKLNGDKATGYGSVIPYEKEDDLKSRIKERLEKTGYPKVLVIGALGRCGSGSCDWATNVGIPKENIIKWDLEETRGGGPFPVLLDIDIVVNCIYLREKIPPFLTSDMLESAGRKLSVLVDVSCDFTSPNNPLPVYSEGTTFDSPIVSVGPESNPLDVVAIDHLPSLLPLESSERFGKDLLPTLLELKDMENSKVWVKARDLYQEKLNEALKKE